MDDDNIIVFNVVEYKTTSELFKQKFVFTSTQWEDRRDGASYDHHFFYNETTTEELILPSKYLEYMITRPLKHNES